MQRMDRYKEVIQQMPPPAPLTRAMPPEDSTPCAKLQRAWVARSPATTAAGVLRSARCCLSRSAGVSPVIRFKNPTDGVAWDDLVKGRIETGTAEMDDSSSPAPTAARPPTTAWWWTTGDMGIPVPAATTT